MISVSALQQHPHAFIDGRHVSINGWSNKDVQVSNSYSFVPFYQRNAGRWKEDFILPGAPWSSCVECRTGQYPEITAAMERSLWIFFFPPASFVAAADQGELPSRSGDLLRCSCTHGCWAEERRCPFSPLPCFIPRQKPGTRAISTLSVIALICLFLQHGYMVIVSLLVCCLFLFPYLSLLVHFAIFIFLNDKCYKDNFIISIQSRFQSILSSIFFKSFPFPLHLFVHLLSVVIVHI